MKINLVKLRYGKELLGENIRMRKAIERAIERLSSKEVMGVVDVRPIINSLKRATRVRK